MMLFPNFAACENSAWRSSEGNRYRTLNRLVRSHWLLSLTISGACTMLVAFSGRPTDSWQVEFSFAGTLLNLPIAISRKQHSVQQKPWIGSIFLQRLKQF